MKKPEIISTKLTAMKEGQAMEILFIIAPSWNEVDIKNLIAVCGNGKNYPLAVFCEENGKPLTAYEEDDPWHFGEWFHSLFKEQAHKGPCPFHKEYHFNETGQEYWYQHDDFRKHYTCCEG